MTEITNYKQLFQASAKLDLFLFPLFWAFDSGELHSHRKPD